MAWVSVQNDALNKNYENVFFYCVKWLYLKNTEDIPENIPYTDIDYRSD